MPEKIWVGVDGGGTRSTLILQNSKGDTLATAEGGPASIHIASVPESWASIRESFEKALKLAHIDAQDSRYEFHAGMGLAGTEMEAAKNNFLETPHPFRTLILDSDAYTACLGAHAGQSGAIMIIGTGVIAYAIAGKTRARVGGWGFPHADVGGGAWLGLEAIRHTLYVIDGRIAATPLIEALLQRFDHQTSLLIAWLRHPNATQFASFAPLVIEYAAKEDPIAKKLLMAAAHEATAVAHALLAKTNDTSMNFCLFGGIAPFIEPYLDDKLKQKIKPRKYDAAYGAIMMVRQQLGC